MTDQLKNILIGLFVVAAVTIIVSMILFLKPTVGDGKQHINVRFTNIAGINMGTRVTFAGKPVGEVVAIQEIADARQKPTDESGRVYFYELALKVDSSVNIYNTDEVAIRTTGLMGEKAIAILPKAALEGVVPKEITHEMVYANSIDPLENTFNQMTKVATKVQTAVEHWDSWFEQNQTHVTEALTSFTDSMQSAHSVLNDLNSVTKEIAEGRGTLGRLLNTDDMYLRFSSLFGKAETLMNDLNHYGLLFQYDKRWQRSRTKKANILKSLETPKEFQEYFSTEVDTITTSLGRLTELLEKAQETTERTKIVQSEAFRRDFASLLRQAQSLTDSIKLYNEGLMTEEALED
jgi:phospholipid/cholesterol/gamma-HCH transport system substrate-binding protein